MESHALTQPAALAVDPVLLMRSGILQKGLPAQWQSNIAVKLSTKAPFIFDYMYLSH